MNRSVTKMRKGSLVLGLAGLLAPGGNAEENRVPSTVSQEAAEFIDSEEPTEAAAASAAEWQALAAAIEEVHKPVAVDTLKQYPVRVETLSIAGADHLLLTPSTLRAENQDRIAVYVHGGAHTLFSPESMLILSAPAAHYLRAKVLSVRYPLAWQRPHPAARDVVVAVYRELLESFSPRRIAMFGDSAGGGLLMSSVLKIRDDGIPMPAVLGLLSPWADVTRTGDSLLLLEGADPTLDYELNLEASADAYAEGQDPKDPSISPIYADFNRGFPPSYISTGTRDLFLSHCARLQRQLIDAGVENQLVIYEGMWHVFQVLRIPEEHDAWRDMTDFFERHWAR